MINIEHALPFKAGAYFTNVLQIVVNLLGSPKIIYLGYS